MDLVDRCASLPRATYTAGAVVIDQGRPPGPVLVLVDGEVTVERDGVPIARIDERGAVFGEMSALLGRPATTTVRASTPSTFAVAADGAAFLAERADVALVVARTLAIRLDNLTGYLADVKRQFGDRDDHLSMIGDVLDTLVHHHTPELQPGSNRLPEVDY